MPFTRFQVWAVIEQQPADVLTNQAGMFNVETTGPIQCFHFDPLPSPFWQQLRHSALDCCRLRLLRIAALALTGFRQVPCWALAIASPSTAKTISFAPLAITTQAGAVAFAMDPGGQAADPSNGAPTTNLGTGQGASPSRGGTEERSS